MGVCSNGVLYVFLRFFEGAWILTLQAGSTDPPGSPRIPPGSPPDPLRIPPQFEPFYGPRKAIQWPQDMLTRAFICVYVYIYI